MPDERSLGEAVNRTARLLRRLADQRLAPFGVSAGHLPVLTALSDGEAMSQKALTERAGIEQPTMAATLARMERDGAIVRCANPGDRRSVLFTLSAGAKAAAAQLHNAIGELNAEALAGFCPADVDHLLAMLTTVAASIEAALDRPASSSSRVD